MDTALIITALLMGVVGGPHCLVMCGWACSQACRTGRDQAPTTLQRVRRLASFHMGRITGYALLGAWVSGSVGGLAWLAAHVPVLHPLWVAVHVFGLVLGVGWLILGRQPVWLNQTGQSMWRKVQPFAKRCGHQPSYVLGVVWALMPCGLLYSALLLAALAANVLHGALVMAAFCLGTGLSLSVGAWLWQQGRDRSLDRGVFLRLFGAVLMVGSAWALWHDMSQHANGLKLFC